MENFDRIGDVNWRAESGAIVGDKGKGGHLVTKKSYKDFEIYAEFWADHTTNSGIRASDAKKVGAARLRGQHLRPAAWSGVRHGCDREFCGRPTECIQSHKAGGKWNTYEIYAKGPNVTVKFNGHVTVHMVNDKFASGPFTLQSGNGPKDAPGGAIKWRKVQVREL